jgi:hypothetical protein
MILSRSWGRDKLLIHRSAFSVQRSGFGVQRGQDNGKRAWVHLKQLQLRRVPGRFFLETDSQAQEPDSQRLASQADP